MEVQLFSAAPIKVIMTYQVNKNLQYVSKNFLENNIKIINSLTSCKSNLELKIFIKDLHNADVAIMAADDRKYHLEKIMRKKKCDSLDNINDETSSTSSSSRSISKQLKELNKLHKSGALTEEEFKGAKKKVLNQ